MGIDVVGPLTSADRLDEVAPLWRELHRHHLDVASYPRLVRDVDESWRRRRRWYESLLADRAALFIAEDAGRAVGYALVHTSRGADDTFAAESGTAELVSLVVTVDYRGRGVGKALLAAAERQARADGADVCKVAVMVGNHAALGFYKAAEFLPAEDVLYRPLAD